jgi:histidinol-phosphate aminotransferase
MSRRGFARVLGVGAAGVLLRPVLVPSLAAGDAPPQPRRGPVRLSANENPYGPSPAVAAAIAEAAGRVARYPDAEAEALQEEVARLHGVAAEQVLLGNGSSQLLRLAAAAAVGEGARVVMADPTFEALGRYARAEGGVVVTAPLTAELAHDLAAMRATLAADGGAALVYLCNPNNPTGTATSPAAVAEFVRAVPGEVMMLIDEAYHHYADGGAGYASALPLVAAHPNVIVARTFSKIHGLAGLRCGYAIGQAPAIERLRAQQPWDSVNVLAAVAARAALADAEHVARSRHGNDQVRAWTAERLAAAGYRVVPSLANFFMVDLRRDVGPVIAALRAQGVHVGRRFPALPNHLRVTVGTGEEMAVFLDALRRVDAVAA